MVVGASVAPRPAVPISEECPVPDHDDPHPSGELDVVDLSVWIARQDLMELAHYARAARLVHGSFGRFLVDGQ